MKPSSQPTIIAASLLLLILGLWAWQEYGGARYPFQPTGEGIKEALENSTDLPLKLPEGFSIRLLAKDLPGARDMAFDGFGNLVVSQTGEGIISLITLEDGKVKETTSILQNLNNPHGLAFDPENPLLLYYAEEDSVSRIPLYSDGAPEKIASLPEGGGHYTRTIRFGSDGRLYVSIGSSCNVCREADERRAKIYSMKKDGSDMKEYARGLRNTVFFTWDSAGRMWGADMGRDQLGDTLPPDEINLIEEGKNYGWPLCYGKNIHDADFDKNTYIRNPCMDPLETASYFDLPAHVAPLGIAVVPNEGWPEEYHHDLLLALHGSWNSSFPVGYKVVRIPMDENGKADGEIKDFISGWLTDDANVLGRPAGIAVQGAAMYLTDDKAGVIYKVTPKN